MLVSSPLPRCVLRITDSFSLKQALALVDIKVLDHFIITAAVALSFAESGLL